MKSVRQSVASLSGGQRQTVAIAKAVLWNSKVVILDEPTAALGVAQTRQVLDLVRRLADRGLGVVLISHNMGDVFEVADRITALYLGRVAADVPAKEVNHSQVVELITAGRSGDLGIAENPATATRLRRTGDHDHDRPTPTPRSDHPSARPPAASTTTTRQAATIGDSARDYLNRLRGGDMGSLPAILGLVVLFVVFSSLHDTFLTTYNMANLVIQAGSIMRPGDGPGLRPAARRDRPVRRRRRRRLRHDHRADAHRPRLALVGGDPGRHRRAARSSASSSARSSRSSASRRSS